jgi:hypothetical protein
MGWRAAPFSKGNQEQTDSKYRAGTAKMWTSLSPVRRTSINRWLPHGEQELAFLRSSFTFWIRALTDRDTTIARPTGFIAHRRDAIYEELVSANQISIHMTGERSIDGPYV